ncbi:hypothetical protein D915_003055 [Fasciola hepatica]|uniref:Shisa N-terminal domain-containing protein n=1 Tax=Fasciola hepatica TaxID=6192 RepID=A0A4E0RGL4_FASHE|nr:hypothetical protein D915_003055 [Fasciola hepatica]
MPHPDHLLLLRNFMLVFHMQSCLCLPIKNATQSMLTRATNQPWFPKVNPVVGRIKWCVNEKRQLWEHSETVSEGQVELLLKRSGKFQCPEQNHTNDMTYCCGELGAQYCCKLTDTPGLKWGVAVGVIVTFIVFLTVSYTIQFFRVCDRCYHECPIVGINPDLQEFQMDTRWYTVSHEGNRYGVTFHSRSFAKEFMECLEEKYGRWNTANILKIQRDGQDFVILNIFFHDVFTPWFYTQGPIKNDEEWIRTDFRAMCQAVRSKLAVRICLCLRLKQNHLSSSGSQQCPDNIQLESVVDTSAEIAKSDNTQQTSSAEKSCNKVMHKWVPWTKASYTPPAFQDEAPNTKSLKRCSTRTKSMRKTDRNEAQSIVNVIIFEELIECNGLDKGVQTRQKHVQSKGDRLIIPDD